MTNGHNPTQEAKYYLDVSRRIAAAKAPTGCRDTAQQKASRTGQEQLRSRAQRRPNDEKVQIALNEAC